MAKRQPTAHDVIIVIKGLMVSKGMAAFETDGRIQLYSGPLSFIKLALDLEDNNHERGLAQSWDSSALRSTVIEETQIGRRLEKYDSKQNIYDYFIAIYGPRSSKAYYHADKVMRFVSREFAKACYGHVETAVCGAGLNKVFFEVELPELIRNIRVVTMNDIPMQRIRDIYYTQGAYVAYREVCKDELQMLQNRQNSKCGNEIKADRKERLQFFRSACRNTFNKIKAGSKEVLISFGPILPHVETSRPIRFARPASEYAGCPAHLG